MFISCLRLRFHYLRCRFQLSQTASINNWLTHFQMKTKYQNHDILARIAYAQTPQLNAHAEVFSGARGLNFGLSLHLHPYFVYASSEGSGESAQARRLAWVFVARRCDKNKKSRGGKYNYRIVDDKVFFFISFYRSLKTHNWCFCLKLTAGAVTEHCISHKISPWIRRAL